MLTHFDFLIRHDIIIAPEWSEFLPYREMAIMLGNDLRVSAAKYIKDVSALIAMIENIVVMP